MIRNLVSKLKFLVVYTLVLLAMSGCTSNPPYSVDDLQSKLEHAISGFQGDVGLYVRHLNQDLELGIHEEWVQPLQELDYESLEKIKAKEKPGCLHQKMMGCRKKNKLDIGTVTMEQIAEWISG